MFVLSKHCAMSKLVYDLYVSKVNFRRVSAKKQNFVEKSKHIDFLENLAHFIKKANGFKMFSICIFQSKDSY